MNVGLPSVNFVDSQACYRPFVLFGQRDSSEEQKTLRIHKHPRNVCTEEPITPSYVRRASPYERPIKEELMKPIRVTKTRTTTVEIDKPFAFLEDRLINQILAMVNGETVCLEQNEETPTPEPPIKATVDVIIKDEKPEEKTN